MSNADLALLPIFLPLAGAALAFAAKAADSGGRFARLLEAAGAVVGLILPWAALIRLLPVVASGGTVAVVGSWRETIGIVQRFDGLAWLVDVLGFTGAGAAYLYSMGGGPRGPGFTAVFLIQTAALAAAASTADLFNLFVCLEVLGLASYVLVASSEKGGAFLAAFSYLTISSAAMVVFLFGVFGLYRLTGSLSYDGIAAALALLPDSGGITAALSTACLAAAVAIRVAVMPVYGWLPDAHALAPHAVSAVLSGVLIKTPLFALGRLLSYLPQGTSGMELIGAAGAATALVAVVVALSQKDAKRLLAYHSISQIGYVVAAWGVGSVAGLTAAFLHALYHALFKGLLFLSVGTTVDASDERDVYVLRGAASALRAAGDRRFVTVAAFAVGALSITAVPPFNGYASKIAVVALFHGDWRYWTLFAAGIGTAASFLKLSRIFWPAAKSPTHAPSADFAAGDVASSPAESASGVKSAFRVTASMKLAMALLAALCLLTGLAGPRIQSFAAELIAASWLPSVNAAKTPANDVAPGTLGLYTADSLIKTIVMLAAGAALFLAISTKIGKRFADIVRSRPRSFAGLVFAFCLGLAVLGGYLVIRTAS